MFQSTSCTILVKNKNEYVFLFYNFSATFVQWGSCFKENAIFTYYCFSHCSLHCNNRPDFDKNRLSYNWLNMKPKKLVLNSWKNFWKMIIQISLTECKQSVELFFHAIKKMLVLVAHSKVSIISSEKYDWKGFRKIEWNNLPKLELFSVW